MICANISPCAREEEVLLRAWKDVQRDPVTGRLLHIDFYEVQMGDKIKVEVSLAFQGEPPAAHRSNLSIPGESAFRV